MRGVTAITLTLLALIIVCFMSRSAGATSTGFSARTTQRLAGRLVEESQRSLSHDDRNPVTNLVNLVTARCWAQAALHLAGEEAVRKVTGVDPTHLVDKASRRMDKAVRTLNDRLPRSQRVRVDDVIVASSVSSANH
jgi:hypothetical protein